MSQRILCDRCGRDAGIKLMTEDRRLFRTISDGGLDFEYDLCTDCARAFRDNVIEFMMGAKE